MTKWQKIKEIQRTNKPKYDVISAVYSALSNGITIKDISQYTNLPKRRIENILLGLEPTVKELVLIANAIGYNIQLIPA